MSRGSEAKTAASAKKCEEITVIAEVTAEALLASEDGLAKAHTYRMFVGTRTKLQPRWWNPRRTVQQDVFGDEILGWTILEKIGAYDGLCLLLTEEGCIAETNPTIVDNAARLINLDEFDLATLQHLYDALVLWREAAVPKEQAPEPTES